MRQIKRFFGPVAILVPIFTLRGRVVLCDQTDNYRVRPTPDTILNVLRHASG